jgi:RHH-type rel operon transcriptional repressor/antitoxin RelB
MPILAQLPQDAEKRLEDLARKTGRSKEDYITEAVLEYLDDLEDIYLAEQALERIRRGEERTYSLEEVERELGLGD